MTFHSNIRVVTTLVVLGFLAFGGQAAAEICTIDDVPAATLLLPYFEVDLDANGNGVLCEGADRGVNTLFSINNASATAVLAHVTFWTDHSKPTLDFDVYLTGFDIQTISIYDIFCLGNLPRTASDGQDPSDTISPQGPLSQDINFASCAALPYAQPTLTGEALVSRRDAHIGEFATLFGGCMGADHGDNIARGYVTADTVSQCNLLFPSSAGYFSSGIATNQNVLWGDYFYVDNVNNFAQGETLVHIEGCQPGDGYIGYVGNGAGHCPFAPGDYTFYGRYAGLAGQDQREPLPTTFGSRFIQGGDFTGGTDLIVWRDGKTTETGASAACLPPSWFPLAQTDVVGFDEQEQAEDLCQLDDIVSPPFGGELTCFPLEAGRYPVHGVATIGAPLNPSADFGWLYMNLNHTIAADPFPGVAQAWVTTVMDADSRFSVGFDAVALDNACFTNPGGVILIP
jgi:hypothetical protein